MSVRHSVEIDFSGSALAYQIHRDEACADTHTHTHTHTHASSSNQWGLNHLSRRLVVMTPKQVDLHLNRAQLWLFLFWCRSCSARVGGSSLSSSTGGRWCSWGSLINSSRAFISSLMDLVRAHQGFDYLPLAMQRDWLHMCVLVFVRKPCEPLVCACVYECGGACVSVARRVILHVWACVHAPPEIPL